MIFEKKKIQIETLSEYLLAVRENLNLSIEEVSKIDEIIEQTSQEKNKKILNCKNK